MAANQVLQAIQNSQAGLAQGKIDVAAAYDQKVVLEAANAQLALGGFVDNAGNTVDSLRQAEIGKLQAQEYAQEFARMRGLDPTATSDLLRQQAENARNADIVAMQQGSKINEMESVGLTDNPIEYLLNQWMLPDEYAKYDGAVNASKEAHSSIQAINADTQVTAKTALDIANTRTIGTIESKVQAAKNSLEMQANDYKIKSIMTGAAKIEAVEKLTGEQLQRAHTAWNIQNSEERLRLEREAAQQRRKEWNLRLKDIESDQAVRAEYVKTIQAAEKANGLPETSAAAIPGLLKAEGQKGMYYRWLLDRGYAIKSGAAPSIGENVVERAMVLNTLPGLVAGNKNAEIVARVVHGAPEVAASTPDVQGKGKTKEGKLALAEGVVDNKLKEWSRITPGDENNPIANVPFSSFAADAAIVSSPVWQAIAGRIDLSKPVDLRVVIDAANADIKAGTKAFRVDDVAEFASTLMQNYKVKANVQARVKFITGKEIGDIKMPVNSYGFGSFLTGDAGRHFVGSDVNELKKAIIEDYSVKAGLNPLYNKSGLIPSYLQGSAGVGVDAGTAAGKAIAGGASNAAEAAGKVQVTPSNILEGRTAQHRANNPIVSLSE